MVAASHRKAAEIAGSDWKAAKTAESPRHGPRPGVNCLREIIRKLRKPKISEPMGRVIVKKEF
jgi:hypothetical protein